MNNIIIKKRGFSLIELLVALSILAVVAAIIVPRFLNVRTQASITTAQAQQRIIQNAVQQWMSLGGTCTETTDTATAGSLLDWLSSSPHAGGNGKCTDSAGNFGSTTIGVQITKVTSGTGFTWVAGTSANYTDGAGNLWSIKVTPGTGVTKFSYVSGGANNGLTEIK